MVTIINLQKQVKLLKAMAYERDFTPKFDPSILTPCHESGLIKALNELSGLKFDWGHHHYLVDAFSRIDSPEDEAEAKKIQSILGHGKIRYHQDQRFFVLKHINKGQIAKDIEMTYVRPSR